jgi:hypothetical protein
MTNQRKQSKVERERSAWAAYEAACESARAAREAAWAAYKAVCKPAWVAYEAACKSARAAREAAWAAYEAACKGRLVGRLDASREGLAMEAEKLLRRLRLQLEREQAAAACRLMASEVWKEYSRASAEAFARFDAACAGLVRSVGSETVVAVALELHPADVDTLKDRR